MACRSSVRLARKVLVLCLLISLPASARAKERPLANVSKKMSQAAVGFLNSLDKPLRAQATFPFDGRQRTDWHFIPKDRSGVSFKEMSLEQRRMARLLMRSALSEKGYFKATTIMSLEQVLRTLEADRENVESIRDPEKYWFAVFGDPQSGDPWGWRVEGHHLSLNFTSIDGVVASSAPVFMGANPAEVRSGSLMGMRVLGGEEDQARRLMSMLTTEQRGAVMISSDAPRDVLTVPGKSLDLGTPKGLSGGEMTKRQRAALKLMVANFLRHLRNQIATEEIRRVEVAGVDKIYFAWAGSLDPAENHYFRLHGPTFVLEYDNAQGNHAHLVWHSRKNDFGASVLERHYATSPHHAHD